MKEINIKTQILILIRKCNKKNNRGITISELLYKINIKPKILSKHLKSLSDMDIIEDDWCLIDGIYSKTISMSPDSIDFMDRVISDIEVHNG